MEDEVTVKFKENWTGVFDEATCLVNNTSMRELAKATIEANIAAAADYEDGYDPEMFDIFNPWYDGPMTDDSETEPDDSETEPDDSETEPDDSETEPDDSETEPDDSDTDPVTPDDSDKDTDPEKPDDKGCGGSITMAGIAMVAALGAAAVVITKKKED